MADGKEGIAAADFSREADILKAMGHPMRLRIVAGLLEEGCCVREIWECLGLPQAVVSQHLSLLRRKGIVQGTREGNKTRYSVIDPLAARVVREGLKRGKREEGEE